MILRKYKFKKITLKITLNTPRKETKIIKEYVVRPTSVYVDNFYTYEEQIILQNTEKYEKPPHSFKLM